VCAHQETCFSHEGSNYDAHMPVEVTQLN
jgi:hypothetical protein